MYEIIIKGAFMTGTTIDDEEEAKSYGEKLLLELLEKAKCCGINGLFSFNVESVSAEKL